MVGIGLDEFRRVASEAEGWAATRVALRGELRRQPLLHAPAVATQPGLGRLGQIHELIPVPLAAAQELLVAEPDRHARRMEIVLQHVECLAEVALPAVDVGGHEHLVGARPPRLDRLAHRAVAVHRGARARHAERESRVDEAEAGHGCCDEAALRLWAIPVELAGRALPDPEGCAPAVQLVRGLGQAHRSFLRRCGAR